MEFSCCSCFRRRKDFQRPENEKQRETSSSSEVIDIFEDEGTNIQEDLWQTMLLEGFETMKTSADPLYQELSKHATFDSSLEFLRNQYSSHGHAQKLPVITKVLKTIQPFTLTVTTLCQSSGLASLVWGSVQFVLQVIMAASGDSDPGRNIRKCTTFTEAD